MNSRFKEISFFGLAGIIGYLIDVLATLLFVPLLGIYLARIPAFLLAATTTWVINRSVTFKSKRPQHGLLKEYLHYLVVMLGGLVINYLVFAAAVTLLPNTTHSIFLAVAMGSLTGMLLNYSLSRRHIYKKGDGA